jgi:hypothetical protein
MTHVSKWEFRTSVACVMATLFLEHGTQLTMVAWLVWSVLTIFYAVAWLREAITS